VLAAMAIMGLPDALAIGFAKDLCDADSKAAREAIQFICNGEQAKAAAEARAAQDRRSR
jgi:hypothetical protein